MCKRAGFSPRITGTCINFETLLLMVQTGTGIAILSKFAPIHSVEGIVCVELEDAPIVSMDVIWRGDFTNNAIHLFVDMMKQLERE